MCHSTEGVLRVENLGGKLWERNFWRKKRISQTKILSIHKSNIGKAKNKQSKTWNSLFTKISRIKSSLCMLLVIMAAILMKNITILKKELIISLWKVRNVKDSKCTTKARTSMKNNKDRLMKNVRNSFRGPQAIVASQSKIFRLILQGSELGTRKTKGVIPCGWWIKRIHKLIWIFISCWKKQFLFSPWSKTMKFTLCLSKLTNFSLFLSLVSKWDLLWWLLTQKMKKE